MEGNRLRKAPVGIQELLLDAVADSRRWDAVVKRLCGILPARIGLLELHPPAPSGLAPKVIGAWGFSRGLMRRYLSCYASDDRGLFRWPSEFQAGGIFCGHRISSGWESKGVKLHIKNPPPPSLQHSMFAVVNNDEACLGVLAFLRSGEEGAFGRSEIARLRKLLPNLRSALQGYQRLKCQKTRSRAVQEILTRVRIGMVTLDERGIALTRSRRAGEILEKRDGISLASGRLRFADPEDARTFSLCLNRILDREGDHPPGTQVMSLKLRRGDEPLFLLILALAGEGSASLTRAPRAIVVMMEPDPGMCPPAELLIEVFGLSPAEARFASLIGRGLDLKECACRLGIRIHTARTHLKHVFTKTRTSRQGELVRLLLNSPETCLALEGVSIQPPNPAKGRPQNKR